MTMIPARARTCITSSGVQHTSHKATVPPTCTLHWVVSLKQKKNHLSFSLSLFSCLALFAWGINWPTLVQKILLKALNQHIRYSKHYNGVDKITLLFFFLCCRPSCLCYSKLTFISYLPQPRVSLNVHNLWACIYCTRASFYQNTLIAYSYFLSLKPEAKTAAVRFCLAVVSGHWKICSYIVWLCITFHLLLLLPVHVITYRYCLQDTTWLRLHLIRCHPLRDTKNEWIRKNIRFCQNCQVSENLTLVNGLFTSDTYSTKIPYWWYTTHSSTNICLVSL